MKEHNRLEHVITRLESQGVVIDKDKLGELQNAQSIKTIFIKVISVLGGLLGMSMFLGFLFLLLSPSHSENIPLFVISILLLGVTYVINKSSTVAIKDGLAVSTFISGFVLFEFAIGLGEYESVDSVLALVGLLLSIISLVVYRNQIITFLAMAGVLISINCLIVFKEAYLMLPYFMCLLILLSVYLFYREEIIRGRSALLNQLYTPIFTATFCYTLFMSIMGSTMRYYQYFNAYSVVSKWALIVVLIATTIFTLHLVLNKLQITSLVTRVIAYALVSVFLYLIGFGYPAFAVSVLFLLWSFKTQYKVGFVVSISALIWSMGMFYYDLSITLLSKSISLMLSGVFFLAIYWLIHKKWNEDETV